MQIQLSAWGPCVPASWSMSSHQPRLILLTFRDASEIRPHLQRTHLQQVGGLTFLMKRGKNGRMSVSLRSPSKRGKPLRCEANFLKVLDSSQWGWEQN